MRARGNGMQEAIGWASSIILLLTIGKQVYKQWKEGSSENVSAGSRRADGGSVGSSFSWLVRNWSSFHERLHDRQRPRRGQSSFITGGGEREARVRN